MSRLEMLLEGVRHNRPVTEMTDDVVDELVSTINNISRLYNRKINDFWKNLTVKIAQGKYNRALAVKLFMYLADDAARAMSANRGRSGLKGIPKSTRAEAAEMLRDEFEEAVKDGSYDLEKFIPKKYKGVKLRV